MALLLRARVLSVCRRRGRPLGKNLSLGILPRRILPWKWNLAALTNVVVWRLWSWPGLVPPPRAGCLRSPFGSPRRPRGLLSGLAPPRRLFCPRRFRLFFPCVWRRFLLPRLFCSTFLCSLPCLRGLPPWCPWSCRLRSCRALRGREFGLGGFVLFPGRGLPLSPFWALDSIEHVISCI